MLKRLYIKNIALISEADIEFDEKLNVLSGETGSGKSVILDSINFVLGSKADKTMIRNGEHEASVRAEFSVEENCPAVQCLKDMDIDSDGTIVISRRFSIEGKGGIKINGNAVTVSMLKSVTQHLVDVHGQSEHYFLLNEDNQLKVLDEISDINLDCCKQELAGLIGLNRELKRKIASFGGDASERELKLDLLKFQIGEITSADIYEGEYDELKAKQNIIDNAERILSALNGSASVLSCDGGCIDGISSIRHNLNGIASLGKEYSEIVSRLESVGAELSDIEETLLDLADGVSFDAHEAQETEERINLLRSLRKKYGADESEILKFLDNITSQYELLSDGADAVEKFNAEINANNGKIFKLCRKITEARIAVAEKFGRQVVSELKTLNIPNAEFSVAFEDYDENSVNLNSAEGSDKVKFMFTANKGEPLKELNKVISGGEMSRFMLAVKTVLKNVNGISTYIFDEIDTGISGFTAKTVAEKFIKISESTQILAVSHLPQVCAASSAQFLIYKSEENGKTVTNVKRLDAESKVSEIIRLTGGNIGSDVARRHAEELIAQFSDK